MTTLDKERPTALEDVPVRVLPDAVTVITVFLVVLLVIPSARRIETLGAAGTPALLLATLALLLWGWNRFVSRREDRRFFNPVRGAFVLLVVGVLASYAVSSMMALPAAERSVADTGMLRLAAIAGILLIALDGVTSRERFVVLMRRITMFGGLYATLGLLQFFTGQKFVNHVTFPGLSDGVDVSFGERAGFVRAIATAMHPLETALVVVMILPIALTLAIYDRKRTSLVRWYPVAAIVFLSVLSVTRSAILGVAAVFAILFWTWPKAVKQWMGLVMVLGAIGIYVAVPGMVGTIIGLFLGDDPSLTSRLESYDTVASLVGLSPVFGRGLGMLLPSYRILDNQFLLALVEIGIVGLLGLLALIAAACWAAVSRRKVWAPLDEIMSAFGVALLASVLGGSLLVGFFDAFSFPQATGIFFLIIGLCGAYFAMSRAEAIPESFYPQRPRPRRGRMRMYLTVATTLIIAGISVPILTTPPLYYARVDVIFLLPPVSEDSNELMGDPGVTLYLAGIVEQTVNDRYGGQEEMTTSAPFYSSGVRHGHLVYMPNTGGQWQTSYDRPLIAVEVVGESADDVEQRLDLYAGRVSELARTSQDDLGIPSRLHVRTMRSPETPHVETISTQKTRAGAGLAALTILAVAVVSGERPQRHKTA